MFEKNRVPIFTKISRFRPLIMKLTSECIAVAAAAAINDVAAAGNRFVVVVAVGQATTTR